MMKKISVLALTLTGLVAVPGLAEAQKTGATTQTAAEAKEREGKTGTSNENQARMLKEQEAREAKESATPSPTPKQK
jgi:hypothetical protein